jgi:hypothetical protein
MEDLILFQVRIGGIQGNVGGNDEKLIQGKRGKFTLN